MTAATIASRSDASVAGIDSVQRGPILVATDGSTACDAALNAARSLAALHDSEVTLLSIVEPIVTVPMHAGIAFPYSDIEEAQRTARETKVLAQLERVGARDADWSMRIEYGEPANAIATAAHDLDATVVITGLGHHDLLDRVLGGETSLRILRASKSPVLAVQEPFEEIPRRVVIATDFSVASLDAARAALRLFPTITAVHLVHVMSALEVPPDVIVNRAGLYSEPVPDSFERFVHALDLPSTVTVQTTTLEGKASREVLQFARKVGADLIVTGSRGGGLMNRLLVGSTATGIIRGANCAVLAVPATRESGQTLLTLENSVS